MAKTPPRAPPQDQAQIDAEVNEGGPPAPTPLERMTDLTRRIVHVPKSEIAKTKPKKRKR
jgi:hypothetical protein